MLHNKSRQELLNILCDCLRARDTEPAGSDIIYREKGISYTFNEVYKALNNLKIEEMEIAEVKRNERMAKRKYVKIADRPREYIKKKNRENGEV